MSLYNKLKAAIKKEDVNYIYMEVGKVENYFFIPKKKIVMKRLVI